MPGPRHLCLTWHPTCILLSCPRSPPKPWGWTLILRRPCHLHHAYYPHLVFVSSSHTPLRRHNLLGRFVDLVAELCSRSAQGQGGVAYLVSLTAVHCTVMQGMPGLRLGQHLHNSSLDSKRSESRLSVLNIAQKVSSLSVEFTLPQQTLQHNMARGWQLTTWRGVHI